ncbi:MAG: DUF362 domain-containing protein [Phycisphaerae bacterium]
MSEERHTDAQVNSSLHHHCCQYRSSIAASPGDGLVGKLRWAWSWLWHFVLRNRVAIFIASLFWLLYRSGTKPQRLAYPCQQVAAVNVGAFIAALVPVSLFLRKHKHGQMLPKAVIVRRQVIAAAILCVVGVVGIETYQYADQLLQPAATLPNVPPPAVEPPPALVGIAHKPYPNWRKGSPIPSRPPFTASEIDALVERAVTLAGGLDQIMVDKNSDNVLDIVLKPNLVIEIPVATYPENGLVTDPRVMASVVRLVKEAAAHTGLTALVRIAEGSACGFPWDGGNLTRTVTKTAFINCGYTSDPASGRQWFTYDPTVELIDLNDSGGLDQFDPAKVTQVTIDNAICRRQYWVPNIVLNCDVLIGVPTLKNHSNADLTVSMKNQGIGCGPSDIYHSRPAYGVPLHLQQMKHAMHFTDVPGLNAWDPGQAPGWDYPANPGSDENAIVNYTIVDMNLFRPMDFAIVDGLIGITNGPATWPAGQPNPHMQLIVAGKDAVAVDTTSALLMGYDPQYVRYLRWAYNRQLGTMNTSRITQVGDHVALWRYPFEANWNSTHAPNGAQAETTPPMLGGISIVDGTTLVTGQKVTVNSFSDNVAVTRAELAVAVLGSDLLTNGDFENGDTGWTRWQADGWGSGWAWDFNNPNVSPMGGTKCLRLGNETTYASFGVYQQVAVTPGKTYRLDCQWKGKRLGDQNWWEVILIDGPFDLQQADTDVYVEKNYMFAYDNYTYGFPGPIGSGFGWVWTHNQYAPPKDQVDWNHRLGRRKATGNIMTVVLKAGSNSAGGVEAYFDNVTLREVSEDYVLDAVSNPTWGVQLTADMSSLPVGQYPGELRVTVYDAMLNESSIYRNVNLQPIPLNPWVCKNKDALYQEVFVGDPIPSDNVEIWNCGGEGGDLNYEITTNVPWIHVVPDEGVSVQNPPTTNLHVVSYDPLPPGVHTGKITITGSHNVVSINVTVVITTVKPDFDADGDVDETDFGFLQQCYTGNVQVSGRCASADFDGDMFVTRTGDLPVFVNCLSGPGVYPDRDCD